MPMYEYTCQDCQTNFELIRSIQDADAPVQCIKCHSENVKRRISLFNASSNGRPPSPGEAIAAAVLAGPCSTCGGSIMKSYQSALITGGSSGIGLALAELLVKEGTHVCLLARDETRLAKAKEDLLSRRAAQDQHIDTISCDIVKYEALNKELKQWVAERGTP